MLFIRVFNIFFNTAGLTQEKTKVDTHFQAKIDKVSRRTHAVKKHNRVGKRSLAGRKGGTEYSSKIEKNRRTINLKEFLNKRILDEINRCRMGLPFTAISDIGYIFRSSSLSKIANKF